MGSLLTLQPGSCAELLGLASPGVGGERQVFLGSLILSKESSVSLQRGWPLSTDCSGTLDEFFWMSDM